MLVDRLHEAYGKDFDQGADRHVWRRALLVVASVRARAHAAAGPSGQASERDTFTFTTRTGIAAIALGFVLGLILGLTSVGSGALIGVALIVLFRLTPQRVVGSRRVRTPRCCCGSRGSAHVISGNVDYSA